jgi:CHASE2 domain-containing sensor protein
MNQLALLRLEGGSFQQGFSNVMLQIGTENYRHRKQLTASLPPAPDLAELYLKWQFFYVALYSRLGRHLRITFPTTQLFPTNVSEAGFSEICQQLKARFNEWLDCKEFRSIERQLRTHFTPEKPIRVSIETNNLQLRQFPWHLWNFFQDFRYAEMALSTSRFDLVRSRSLNPTGQVRILAVFGNRRELDLELDLAALEQLPNTKLTCLCEPTRRALNDQLWKSSWDIFFFAGHSASHANGESGQLEISPTESLSVSDLHYALRHAIEQGLQLAIFNSCEGLGIVRELEKIDLHIPTVVVMREPVPDKVAQAFLTYFLESFSQGQSLYLAVRQARERLQGLEHLSGAYKSDKPPATFSDRSLSREEAVFPCASWLPIICQNPTTQPPSWEQLRQSKWQKTQIAASLKGLILLGTSAIVALLAIGLRLSGGFQAWELQAFDFLLRLRPNEGIDTRLLMVEVTEADVNRYGFPLPDAVLELAIAKLEQHDARVIGLDIFRSQPVGAGHRALMNRLRDSERAIAICSASQAGDANKPGMAPPPGLGQESLGFSDVVVDPDGVLRRHLLFMQPEASDACATDHSLSARLAFRYLATQGIEPKSLAEERIQLGKAIFTPLSNQTGAYQQIDARGFQILLNYSAGSQVIRRVSISDLLRDRIDSHWIEDRAILIGVTAPISSDYFSTPYSTQRQSYQQMPGVLIQTQMLGQILSAALDGRALLWFFPQWGDSLWIWGWSFVGGTIAWHFHRIRYWLPLSAIAITGLSGICLIVLTQGGWVPLIPPALALATTGALTYAYKSFVQQRQP